MLSNPRSNFHERHRQHRRQISTPSTIEAGKVPSLPAPALKRIQAHRRGQSLDQRSLHFPQSQSVQDGTQFTNTAAHEPPRQHQLSQHLTPMTLMSGLGQEDMQALNRNGNENHPNMTYMNPNVVNAQPHMSLTLNMLQQQQLRNPLPGNNALDSQFIDNGVWGAYQQDNLGAIQQPHALPGDIRRMSVQSDIGTQAPKPHTPTKANIPYLPITPATTPFKKTLDIAQYNRDEQASPTKRQGLSMAGLSQGSYMQRAKSLQGVPGATGTQQKTDLPSPPNTASFEIDSFDAFDCSQESSFDNPESQNLSQNHYPSSVLVSAPSSFYSSPELAAMPSPADSKTHKVPIYPATPTRMSHQKMPSEASISSVKPKLSPRVASIDNLNLDDRVHASIKETGVTIDEIASYIRGPEPEDGKWMCLHPGCGRRFGRKENIKSHVQTHLGDRQYKCDHCEKCFVRGHDLKRHAKIHTGDKPYECLCGNVFARHDALTRHRQRGMCIGGYKGIVRKTTKRGRPKKHRPEMEERQDKAFKTRQRAAEKFSSSESLPSSGSVRNSPPSEVFENMSVRGSSPLDEMPTFTTPNYSLPPEVFTFTPPASPGCSTGNKPSPTRTRRSLTPNSEDGMLPLSPSKQPLGRIEEESGLPFISDAECTDMTNSTAHTMSSPHTAPTLADESNDSDLDIFINQDASTGFTKQDFPELDSEIAPFPDYVNPLEGGLDLFQAKSFPTAPSMNDDFFSFQFQVDEQPSDLISREFFLD